MGMMLIKGDESLQDIICLAYGLVEGLRKFYAAASQLAIETEVSAVLARLAELEVRHKQKLFDLFNTVESADMTVESFEKKVNAELMEGGFDSGTLLEEMGPAFKTAVDVLNFAMMLEAQGMDLYRRYAEKSQDPRVKEILFTLADDEKAHLNSLGALFEKI